MKNLWIVVASFAVFGLFAPATSFAGKNKDKKTDKKPDVFAQFDKNANGVLDADEKEAVRKAFADGNADLKSYDTNSDGKLSDDEMAGIRPAKQHHKKKESN